MWSHCEPPNMLIVRADLSLSILLDVVFLNCGCPLLLYLYTSVVANTFTHSS